MPRLFIPTLDTIGTLADNDLFIVSDVSVNKTEKVTFSSLRSAISGTLPSQVSTLQSQVSTLQSQVSTLQSQVSSLQSQINSLDSRVTALEDA